MEDGSTGSGGGDGGGGGGYSPFSGLLDFCDGEKCSVGFMELLGLNNNSNNNDEFKDYNSEVLNPPATPNSSSVSSASNLAVNDDHAAAAAAAGHQSDHQQHNKPTKLLKVKKRKGKREKEARFAFMTKSEVDHLEDGYRWRKYGQKAVKNSPFPRSYYRCTSAACNVKKRVERSFADPTVVVTTYEGQHTHPSPILTRSTLALVVPPPPFTSVSGGGCAGVVAMSWLKASNDTHEGNLRGMSTHQLHQNPPFFTPQHLNDDYNRNLFGPANAAGFLREKRFHNQNLASLEDHGLLQDVVPPHMLKQE